MSVPQQLSGFNNQIPPRYAIKSITKAYQITGADYGQILNCSGTANLTISTVSAASIGAGFNCWVWNVSTGTTVVVTINPNGSETIDGSLTLNLRVGEGTQITSNGANWLTVSKKTMKYYSENVSSGTPSAASGSDSVAIGNASSSAGISAAALGYTAAASGNYSCALGYGPNASGAYSVAFGAGNAAQKTKYAFGNGVSGGGAQLGMLIVLGLTTNATPVVLTSDYLAAGTTNQIVIGDACAFVFNILVVARQKSSDGSASAAWKIEGLIRRETGAATTAIVGTPTTTVISNVPGWSIAVSADTTNGALAVTATGAASTNIGWSAEADTNEIYYA